MTERVDEMLQVLSEAPPDPSGHAQIDETQTPKLRALIGKSPKEQAVGLKEILDNCAHGSLASGFAMQAMDLTWRMALEDVTRDEVITFLTPPGKGS